MWHRVSGANQTALYKFDFGLSGYNFIITDLEEVYFEQLNATQVSARGTEIGSIFDLSDPNQVHTFCSQLSQAVANSKFGCSTDPIAIHDTVSGIEIDWEFRPTKADQRMAQHILKALILDLLVVVGNLGKALDSVHEKISAREFHIRSMASAIERGVEYEPQNHLHAYTSSFQPPSKRDPPNFDPLCVAEPFWPAQHLQLVNDPQRIPEDATQNSTKETATKPEIKTLMGQDRASTEYMESVTPETASEAEEEPQKPQVPTVKRAVHSTKSPTKRIKKSWF